MCAPLFSLAKKSIVIVPRFYKQRKGTTSTQTSSGAASTFNPQNPLEKQAPLVVPMHKVTSEFTPPITKNSILANNSMDCDDFPLGFEGEKFAKGNFTWQLKEIDKESTKFDTMKGIDINLELLPYQNSTTPKCPNV